MSTKTCQGCGETRLKKLVKIVRHGKTYRRNWCVPCYSDYRKEWRKRNRNRERATSRRSYERRKERRRRGEDVEGFIWRDSRKSDRKHGRDNDLTKAFIAEQIAKGCSYCGEKELRMTLDRVDNERGHTTDNVVPACIRCNYIRRNMPHEAWLCLRTGLRRARREGLFGDWTGKIR